jgi:hypothetical protein
MAIFTIEQLEQMWDADVMIDRSSLDQASLSIPYIHHKYYKIYTNEKLVFKKLTIDFNNLKKVKYEYYLGRLDPAEIKARGWEQQNKLVKKPELDVYLDSDSELNIMILKLTYQKEKLEYLEAIIDSLKQRTWNIKNAIEFLKFSNGV